MQHAEKDPDGTVSHPLYLKIIWNFIFWSIQLFSWIIIPLSQSYATTGEFTILRKLRAAIVENLIMYSIMGGVLGVIAIIVLIVIRGRIQLSTLPNIAMGASNAWGLILLISLVGWAIVELPRAVWHNANLERQLTILEYKASAISNQLDEAEEDLITQLNHVKVAEACAPDELRPFADKLVMLAEPYLEQYHIQNVSRHDKTEITRKHLVKLHNRLKNAINQSTRAAYQWEDLQRRAFFLEDVIDSANNPDRVIVTDTRPPRTGRLARIINVLEWVWMIKLRKIVLRVVSVLLVVCSLLVVYSNIAISIQNYIPDRIDISPLSLLLWSLTSQRWLQQTVAIAAMGYVAYCAYFTLFRLKLFNIYQLVPHHTSAYSMLFLGVSMSRVMPPLCYNFVRMVKMNQTTTFGEVMGKGEPIQYFFIFFPLFILVVIVLTFTRIIERILGLLRIQQFMFEGDQETTELADEGREILKRERRKKQKNAERSFKTASVSTYFFSDRYRSGPSSTAEADSLEAGGGWQRRNPFAKKHRTPPHEGNLSVSSSSSGGFSIDDSPNLSDDNEIEMKGLKYSDSLRDKYKDIFSKYSSNRS
eukprot:GEZU01022030.1.p1 GENE.GEZU01022030.1~~GEZU01022030.1.p1  ORF type:complete len:589 (-),score=115.61 GEZU01022030.1:324-2090(-)